MKKRLTVRCQVCGFKTTMGTSFGKDIMKYWTCSDKCMKSDRCKPLPPQKLETTLGTMPQNHQAQFLDNRYRNGYVHGFYRCLDMIGNVELDKIRTHAEKLNDWRLGRIQSALPPEV